jgi:hypothetical protein
LDPSFGTRLDANLTRLRRILDELSIPMHVMTWDGSALPPFHGWMFAGYLLRGDWARGALGHYHVRTPLKLYTRDSAPDLFELTHAYFL